MEQDSDQQQLSSRITEKEKLQGFAKSRLQPGDWNSELCVNLNELMQLKKKQTGHNSSTTMWET